MGSAVKTDKREIEHRMTRLRQVCRSAGVKLTHQRIEIFRQDAQTGERQHAAEQKRPVAVAADLARHHFFEGAAEEDEDQDVQIDDPVNRPAR